MTQPDLSSLALPDSPELPAEIERAIEAVELGYSKWAEDWNSGRNPLPAQRAIQPLHEKLVAVIAKHLLTAEEAMQLRIDLDVIQPGEANPGRHFKTWQAAVAKLRRLSGSSRGESASDE